MVICPECKRGLPAEPGSLGFDRVWCAHVTNSGRQCGRGRQCIGISSRRVLERATHWTDLLDLEGS